MYRGLFAVLVLALSPRPIVGQEPAAPYRVTWLDAVSVGTAGALYVLPAALGLPHGAPSCAPCDPASLPGVDRWALRPVSATAATASNLLLVGVAGSATFLSVRSEEHTSELQSLAYLVCRLLLEKKKKNNQRTNHCRDPTGLDVGPHTAHHEPRA